MNGALTVPIESRDLDTLREIASKVLITLLWVQVLIVVLIGISRGTDWLAPTMFAVVMAGMATLSWRNSGNGAATRLTVAIAVIADVSIFTYSWPDIRGRSTSICTSLRPWPASWPIAIFA